MTVEELRRARRILQEIPQPKFIALNVDPDSILGREMSRNEKEFREMIDTVISSEMNDASKKKDL